jgi:predicted acyl esterase
VTPGTTYDVPVHVYPQYYRFLKGHRLRISVSSGDLTDAEPDESDDRSGCESEAGALT